jgi:hypothetical protein
VPRAWPHQHRNAAPIVLVDVDGVLADMSDFVGLLDAGDEPRTGGHWRRFFQFIGDAVLLDAGADLVHALHHVGARVQYSTTRPAYTVYQTLNWMTAHHLPAGKLYARGSRKTHDARSDIPAGGPALDIKQAHCALVDDRHGLTAFIDDEPDIVTGLHAAGYPSMHINDLTDATTSRLRQLTQHRLFPALQGA